MTWIEREREMERGQKSKQEAGEGVTSMEAARKRTS
jgi:hypothetical protein